MLGHNAKTSADLRWDILHLKALDFKRSLDRRDSFDFAECTKWGTTLLVGEGNLSFAVSLSRLAGSDRRNMVATTFEDCETYSAYTLSNAKRLVRTDVNVFDAIDATKLDDVFKNYRFDLIVFQFPNVGSRAPLFGQNPNHVLVRRFLRSASACLSECGRVAITTVNSPHYDGAFDADGAADFAGYQNPTSYPFFPSDYRGYRHANTLDESQSAVEEVANFVTLVFKLKGKHTVREKTGAKHASARWGDI